MDQLQQRDSSGTREAMLTAAAKEILDRGYYAASLSSIAARLELTKGALAYHFPNKRDLAVALIERMAEIIEQIIAEVHQRYPDGGVRALVAFLALTSEHAKRTAVVAAGVAIDSDASTGDLELPEQFPLWVSTLKRYLEQADAIGERFPVLDPLAAAEQVLASMVGSFLYLQRVPQRRIAPPLRFLRATLHSIGVAEADAIVDEVLEALRGRRRERVG